MYIVKTPHSKLEVEKEEVETWDVDALRKNFPS
jgi:hypothetical protein